MNDKLIKSIVRESIYRVLNENDNFNGLTLDKLAKLEVCCDTISDIAKNCDDECYEIVSAIDTIEEFIERKKQELIRL